MTTPWIAWSCRYQINSHTMVESINYHIQKYVEEFNNMRKKLFFYIKLPIESILLQTEDKILPESWFSSYQFAKLDKTGGWILFTFKNGFEYFYNSDSVAINHFEIFEILKCLWVLKVVAQLPLVLRVFLNKTNNLTP